MFKTIAEIRQANKTLHNWFFCRDTMTYWHTKVYPYVYKNKYFITKQNLDRCFITWTYAIREAHVNGDIGTIAYYDSLEDARQAVKKLV